MPAQSDNMKILQVIDILEVGGAERVAVDLSNILYENGMNITFLSLQHKGPLAVNLHPSIPHLELNRTSVFSLKSLIRFIRITKLFDIIHIHMRHNLRYVALASMLSPSLRKKIIFHDHYGSINTNQSCSSAMKFILRNCINAYIGVSGQLCEWAKKQDTKKIFLLPNIVRKQNIPSSCAEKERRDFVSVGNIREDKNYEFLLKIAEKLPDKDFTIYGKCNVQPYADGIKNTMGKNVHIINNVSNVQPELQKYNLALHCATSETGPLVLLEYMAQGVPFITYQTGEVVSQIKNELPELIMDTFDIEQWLDRIKFIAPHRTEITDKMRQTFTKYFSEESYFEKCFEIYKRIVK